MSRSRSSWFVALPVQPVVDDAGDWFSRSPPPPDGTRLLAAADLHLTVAFLGNVGESRARAAFRALPPTAIRRFEILLGAIVAMGNPGHPSALSALVGQAAEEGPSIAERLVMPRDVILEAAGLPADPREMKPHITLARLRRKADATQRRRALAWAEEADLEVTRIGIDQVCLYTAARDRKARAYDIVERHDLRP